MTAWTANSPYVAQSFDISFPLGGGYTLDAQNNPVPSTAEPLIIPCRLKRAGLRSKIRDLFPGTDEHRWLLWGWVNDAACPIFPAVIRRQKQPTGFVTYDDIPGRIEIVILGQTKAAPIIGEKFGARFVPTK